MIHYDLSRHADVPKYIALYQYMKNDILTGNLASGEKLPSKRAMASAMGIGLNTVANAYDQLITEGYVYARERRGYFVQELPEEYKSGVLVPEPLAVPEPDAAEEQEETHFADLKANRTSMRLFPSATWNQLMRKTINQGDELFATVPYNGIYDLRRAIADYLKSSRGMHVSPSQIIIGAGTEYLYNRLAQLFGFTTVFGFEDPGYKKLSCIVNACGNQARFVPIDQAGLDVEALEESDVDVIHVAPANHFPTGITMPAGRRSELLEWCYRSSKRYIIEDEYDSEFRYKGDYIPPLYTADSRSRTIYMNTFSKTLVPSLRISYMILPPKLLRRYRESLSFYSCTVSSFEQYTLARFMHEGYFERHIHHIKTYYRKLRLQVLQAVEESALGRIAKVIEFNSGTHFLLRVNTWLTEEEIRNSAGKVGLHLTFASDYTQEFSKEFYRTIIINYAAIEPEHVKEVFARLAWIFPECRMASGRQ